MKETRIDVENLYSDSINTHKIVIDGVEITAKELKKLLELIGKDK